MDELNVKATEAKESRDDIVNAKPKIIAVDFDGCLVTNKYPEIGEPIKKNISRLKQEQANGAKVILWTSRAGEPLNQAVEFCKENGIHLDAVNENLPEIIQAFGGDNRKIFANEYWDDRAVFMAEEIDDWAGKEIELACKQEKEVSEGTDDWAYGVACYESALKAYRSLMEDGHSGMSIGITKGILNRLIDGKCLTPIEDTPDIWEKVTFSKEDKTEHYQCKRMSSLFKDVSPDGKVTYSDINRVHAINVDSPNVAYQNGFVTKLIDNIFPIKMPYLPNAKKFTVVREEFLVDPKMGDYDTVAFLEIITPDDRHIQLNRYFKETKESGMVQIDKAEYEERKAKRVDNNEKQ